MLIVKRSKHEYIFRQNLTKIICNIMQQHTTFCNNKVVKGCMTLLRFDQGFTMLISLKTSFLPAWKICWGIFCFSRFSFSFFVSNFSTSLVTSFTSSFCVFSFNLLNSTESLCFSLLLLCFKSLNKSGGTYETNKLDPNLEVQEAVYTASSWFQHLLPPGNTRSCDRVLIVQSLHNHKSSIPVYTVLLRTTQHVLSLFSI